MVEMGKRVRFAKRMGLKKRHVSSIRTPEMRAYSFTKVFFILFFKAIYLEEKSPEIPYPK